MNLKQVVAIASLLLGASAAIGQAASGTYDPQKIKPGTPVGQATGISNWGDFLGSYYCTYTGPIGGMMHAGPYTAPRMGLVTSSLNHLTLTSPSSYKVDGVLSGAGAFSFGRAMPGPVGPEHRGVLHFTSGPLRGHYALIQNNQALGTKMYLPLDWYADDGKQDSPDPRSSTECQLHR